jgi:hypothetical protein
MLVQNSSCMDALKEVKKRKPKKKTRSRIITKSPVTLAKLALKEAEKAMPTYSDTKSRKDFTQSQIFAILVLKAFFKTDYRGIIDFLEELSDLRKALKLKKVPHYSTLCYAEERLLKKNPSDFFKDPSLIDPRIWDLLEKGQRESLTPPDSKLGMLLGIIGLE